jgi:hypothetical protein
MLAALQQLKIEEPTLKALVLQSILYALAFKKIETPSASFD